MNAASTLPRSASRSSRYPASRSITPASWPESSPAATLARYTAGNSRGNCARASARRCPAKTSLRTAAKISRTARESACSTAAPRAEATGSPAASRLASWRVASASCASEKRRRCRRGVRPCASTSRGTRPRERSEARAAAALSASTSPFSMRPALSDASKRNEATTLALARYAQHFLFGGDAGAHPAHAVLVQRAEAVRGRELAQPLLAFARMDRRAQRLVDLEELVDSCAAVIAGLRAFRASGAVAIDAELAHQALRQDPEHRGREQEGLDAHV